MAYATDRRDRGKALALVVALHVALGFALVAGLAGETARRVADSIKSFDVTEVPPPPRPEPPPPPEESSAAPEDEPAPPDLRAQPAPVIAPKPPIPLPIPSPVRTSDERGPEGADRSAGAAAVSGPGTGAGGSGTGFGGGGSGGSGSGAGVGSGARLLSGNLARRDYRRLSVFGIPTGSAVLALYVGTSGRLTGCAPIEGSGRAELDAEICRLMMRRSRWAPARDRSGKPIVAIVRYTATWDQY